MVYLLSFYVILSGQCTNLGVVLACRVVCMGV